jgi:alkylation response protein AidB-like acyl-CoA dehydrogenase
MNFDFTDDQQAIKSTAHDFLAARLKPEKLRQLAEAGEYDDALWKEMSELGWPGIFIGEEHGGQGLGVVELVILMEELGYALAPSPFLSNVAAGLMIQHAGSDEQRDRWLPGIASGEQRGTVAYVVNGVASLVPDADTADFVVLFDEASGTATVAERGAVQAQPIDTIDSTRRFSRVTPNGSGSGEELSGGRGEASEAIAPIAVALSGELVGVSQRAMEMAVEYAKDRQQFGRPIGAYQAVSHRCAQMLLETEGARSATLYAAWTADHEPESLQLAGSMAKAYASDCGWRVTASSLQVHGGIGFTWEHDLHFFLKRAKTDGHLFGSAREHRERVAELAGLRRSQPAAV